jgi:hypothetical protein
LSFGAHETDAIVAPGMPRQTTAIRGADPKPQKQKKPAPDESALTSSRMKIVIRQFVD